MSGTHLLQAAELCRPVVKVVGKSLMKIPHWFDVDAKRGVIVKSTSNAGMLRREQSERTALVCMHPTQQELRRQNFSLLGPK